MSYFPIVLETEASGAVSAYVPGLPVYAAADSHRDAEQAIRDVLAAYLEEHPDATSETRVRVARVSGTAHPTVEIVSVAALVGSTVSRAKAQSSRANGKLGGRPRLKRAKAR
jgi:predicted RNase H-like HicB family nuclease